MRWVFIGATSFGKACLETCLNVNRFELTGIISSQQFFEISYSSNKVNNVLHTSFNQIASDLSVDYLEVERGLNDPQIEFAVFEKWRPDAILVAGWYHMVPKSWLQKVPVYGLHASLLPKYAGGAPLVWAIINGERQSGITLFQMDDGVDTGPIVGQLSVTITQSETIATLYKKVQDQTQLLLDIEIPKIINRKQVLKYQNEEDRLVMPQRSPADGEIDWHSSCYEIDRFIRAQTRPYPGAFTKINGAKFTIWKARPTNDVVDHLALGEIGFRDESCCYIKCKKGVIILEDVQFNNEVYKTSASICTLMREIIQ